MQLSICGEPATAGTASHDSLHIITRQNSFVKQFSKFFYDFFRKFSKIFPRRHIYVLSHAANTRYRISAKKSGIPTGSRYTLYIIIYGKLNDSRCTRSTCRCNFWRACPLRSTFHPTTCADLKRHTSDMVPLHRVF